MRTRCRAFVDPWSSLSCTSGVVQILGRAGCTWSVHDHVFVHNSALYSPTRAMYIHLYLLCQNCNLHRICCCTDAPAHALRPHDNRRSSSSSSSCAMWGSRRNSHHPASVGGHAAVTAAPLSLLHHLWYFARSNSSRSSGCPSSEPWLSCSSPSQPRPEPGRLPRGYASPRPATTTSSSRGCERAGKRKETSNSNSNSENNSHHSGDSLAGVGG